MEDQTGWIEVAAAITVRETAERLSISRSAVTQLIQRGTLPATKIGNMYILDIRDVMAYEDEWIGKRKPGPKPGTPKRRNTEPTTSMPNQEE